MYNHLHRFVAVGMLPMMNLHLHALMTGSQPHLSPAHPTTHTKHNTLPDQQPVMHIIIGITHRCGNCSLHARQNHVITQSNHTNNHSTSHTRLPVLSEAQLQSSHVIHAVIQSYTLPVTQNIAIQSHTSSITPLTPAITLSSHQPTQTTHQHRHTNTD
jgi:hypothetical protein